MEFLDVFEDKLPRKHLPEDTFIESRTKETDDIEVLS